MPEPFFERRSGISLPEMRPYFSPHCGDVAYGLALFVEPALPLGFAGATVDGEVVHFEEIEIGSSLQREHARHQRDAVPLIPMRAELGRESVHFVCDLEFKPPIVPAATESAEGVINCL